MSSYKIRITKRDFYKMGGFSNTNLFRKGTNSGWTYWKILGNITNA